MSISFNCPGCGVNIYTSIYDVIRIGFSCAMCGKEIVPDAVFGTGKLDRDKEMLAWIGEATVAYMQAHDRIMKQARADGVNPFDASIWRQLNPLAAEVQQRIAIYKGENYDE